VVELYSSEGNPLRVTFVFSSYVPIYQTITIKKPLLFAEGGEKEEKSRGKNEKAIVIISHF